MNKIAVDVLIALKNASLVHKEFILVKNNILVLKIIKNLYLEGLIQSFAVETSKSFQIKVYLRYSFNKNFFKNLKIFSTPITLKYFEICKLSTKQNLIFISTPLGFLTGEECKKRHLGGKLYFQC